MTSERVGLRLTLCLGADLATVEVAGEIDQSNAAAFAEAIRDLGIDRQVVLDLSGISFLGAPGLEAITRCAARCIEGGERMTVRNPPYLVRRLLRSVGLDDIADIEPEREDEPDLRLPAPLDTDELERVLPSIASSTLLGSALRARTVIAQAEGVLMARNGIGAEAASAEIRRSATVHGITLAEHAANILAAAAERPVENRVDR